MSLCSDGETLGEVLVVAPVITQTYRLVREFQSQRSIERGEKGETERERERDGETLGEVLVVAPVITQTYRLIREFQSQRSIERGEKGETERERERWRNSWRGVGCGAGHHTNIQID